MVLVSNLVLRQLALIAEEFTVQLPKFLVYVSNLLASFHNSKARFLADAGNSLEVVLGPSGLLLRIRFRGFSAILGELILEKLHLHL